MGGKASRDKGVNSMQEIWKPIEGYEGYYEVSNLGNVRSVERTARFVSSTGRECIRRVGKRTMATTLNKKRGRLSVMLSKNHKKKRFYVHRLVANAFCENPNKYTEINHKDEDPTNNRADNLEWCTRDYNMHYGTIWERIRRHKRPVERINGAEIKRYDAVRHVEKDGFCSRGVYRSVEKNVPYRGYYWRFV